jgi:hypothetical protein
MNARRIALAVATTVAATTVVAGATPAFAKGTPAVSASTKCSTGVIKLKAKHENSRIEIEAEVDTNRNGQTWSLRLSDNGTSVFLGKRTTHAPSGSFSVSKLITNRAGTDVMTATARRGSTVCTTHVSL